MRYWPSGFGQQSQSFSLAILAGSRQSFALVSRLESLLDHAKCDEPVTAGSAAVCSFIEIVADRSGQGWNGTQKSTTP